MEERDAYKNVYETIKNKNASQKRHSENCVMKKARGRERGDWGGNFYSLFSVYSHGKGMMGLSHCVKESEFDRTVFFFFLFSFFFVKEYTVGEKWPNTCTVFETKKSTQPGTTLLNSLCWINKIYEKFSFCLVLLILSSYPLKSFLIAHFQGTFAELLSYQIILLDVMVLQQWPLNS